jgi:hypothetical protein
LFTSYFPNIKRIIGHHLAVKNDAGIPYYDSQVLLDEAIYYRFNRNFGNQNGKVIKKRRIV